MAESFSNKLTRAAGIVTSSTGGSVGITTNLITGISTAGVSVGDMVVNQHYISGTKISSYGGSSGQVIVDRDSTNTASASNQSTLIVDRAVLENEVNRLEKLYENKDVPRPDHWGGYLLSPSRIEFWQGRASRLHDRCLYELHDDDWKMSRLAP